MRLFLAIILVILPFQVLSKEIMMECKLDFHVRFNELFEEFWPGQSLFKYEQKTFFSDRVFIREGGQWKDFCGGVSYVKDKGASCIIGKLGKLPKNVDRTRAFCTHKKTKKPTNNLSACIGYSSDSIFAHNPPPEPYHAYENEEFDKRRLILDFIKKTATYEIGEPEAINVLDKYNSKAKGFAKLLGVDKTGSGEFSKVFGLNVSCTEFQP